MHLSAIYIKDHFLFKEPLALNFGGKYIYDFSNVLEITRKDNEKYIENLYGTENIDLVSVIVGKNGSGKTTLLTDIISFLNNQGYGYEYIIFLEKDTNTFKFSNSIKNICLFETTALSLDSLATIYYSPYLDFKEPTNGIDLSYDTIIDGDLKDAENKYFESSKINYKRWLKAKNSIRILEFQSSKYSKEIKAFFDFPEVKRARVSFIRHQIDVDYETDRINFHNTPFDLQYYIQPLYSLIRNEAEKINKNRPEGYSLVNLQKELFKNYIIMDVLCLLIKQMEKTNQYLSEGHLEISTEEYKKTISELSSKEALFKFLDLHYFYGGENKVKILPAEETKEMINYLFKTIDNLEAEDNRDTRNFDWNNKSIYLGIDTARELILYHSKFLNKVDQYYGGIEGKNGHVLYRNSERIDGFISYEPSNRNLSSGETSLLNFYSRIYYYFQKNLEEIESIVRKDFYILFLDEADMGFHPKWKKGFVKSITSFLPSFFKDFDSNIQIIFTTHDPITLSDIPNDQIIYLNKIEDKNIVLSKFEKPKKSFGANVHDLLAHSFFLEDGLIGDFAKEKIKEVLDNLNYTILRNEIDELKSKENSNFKNLLKLKTEQLDELDGNFTPQKKEYIKSIIEIVDEPILKFKLEEMYNEVYHSEIDKNEALKRAKKILNDAGLDIRDLNQDDK